MLEGYRYFPRIGIDVLVEKCLVNISENVLQVSNLIEDMGQDILNGETERCTRMWEPSKIRYLLEDDIVKASGGSKATPVRASLTQGS